MAKKRSLVRAPQYTVEILGRRYPVRDMIQASNFIGRFSGQYGASEIGSQFPVRDGKDVIGYVSYNGKVWKGDPAHWEQAELMYDPFAQDPVHYKGRQYAPRKNPTDAENDAEYKMGWQEGLKMLQRDWRQAEAWEAGPYRDMPEPSWFEMGKADVISEHNVARRLS